MGFKKWYVCWIALLGFSLIGCQRSVSDNSALKIKLPSNSDLQKVGALSTFPGGYKYCYGVSVTGPNINGFPGGSCAPKTGIVVGFKEAGSTIEVQVPKGYERKIEVYVHVPANITDPCPTMSGNLSGARSQDTYLVGTKSGVATVDPVTSVTVAATFPGMANHLASQMSVPPSCLGMIAATPNFRIRSGVQTASGGGGSIYLRGRVGAIHSGQTATGTGYVLHGKISNF